MCDYVCESVCVFVSECVRIRLHVFVQFLCVCVSFSSLFRKPFPNTKTVPFTEPGRVRDRETGMETEEWREDEYEVDESRIG